MVFYTLDASGWSLIPTHIWQIHITVISLVMLTLAFLSALIAKQLDRLNWNDLSSVSIIVKTYCHRNRLDFLLYAQQIFFGTKSCFKVLLILLCFTECLSWGHFLYLLSSFCLLLLSSVKQEQMLSCTASSHSCLKNIFK